MRKKQTFYTDSLVAATNTLLEVGNITVIHCGVCQNEKELKDGSECKACK